MIVIYGVRYRCDRCGLEVDGAPLEHASDWPAPTAPEGWADTSALFRRIDGAPFQHLCGECQNTAISKLIAALKSMNWAPISTGN